MENNKNIEMNMVRERSLKLPTVTDEMYKQCNSENRDMIEEFFSMNPQLSPSTKKQYRSGMRQFLYWLYSTSHDMSLYKAKKSKV